MSTPPGRTHLDEVTLAFQRASVAYFAEAVPLACGWEYVPHPYVHGEVMIREIPKENQTSGPMYNRRNAFSRDNLAPREAYAHRMTSYEVYKMASKGPFCEECKGDLGGFEIGRLESHVAGCKYFLF